MNMKRIINTKQLRAQLPDIVRRTRRGERFIVLHRSRPAFQVVPVDDDALADVAPLGDEPLFEAAAVGRSTDGLRAAEHDHVLYGRRR
jgi:prevent-host-death family protein